MTGPISAKTRDSLTDRHRADPIKSGGVHYTPPVLADFVAGQVVAALGQPSRVRVLDPACGDGVLLAAVARQLTSVASVELVGFDIDGEAVEQARANLSSLPDNCSVTLDKVDFIDAILDELDSEKLRFEGPTETSISGTFDVVIANPPYVRTQVLGADQAQKLASGFGLRGRVDLYQAFAVGMTAALRPRGVVGLLCSNRFLTTKTGIHLRQVFQGKYELVAIYDLGDTKAFEAAVLPAVVIGRRDDSGSQVTRMTSIYAVDEVPPGSPDQGSIFDHLAGDTDGPVTVNDLGYEIRRGQVDVSDPRNPWVPSSTASSAWIALVDAKTTMRFGDVGRFRVGIKTTADSVFIRQDWSEVSPKPEESVLLPLITHHIATRWRCGETTAEVLYPYDLTMSKRRPLDLADLPGTTGYLEQNRERLEGRKYVIEGGRKWWEIWVPQRPSAWSSPKVVCPDISAEPKFFLDRSGAVVNGDCYWLSIDDEDLGLLMLAVANSELGLAYYDAVCGNRLYAGRRRFITQYVERFPLPDRTQPATLELIEVVRQLVQGVPDEEQKALELKVDELVRQSFGVEEVLR